MRVFKWTLILVAAAIGLALNWDSLHDKGTLLLGAYGVYLLAQYFRSLDRRINGLHRETAMVRLDITSLHKVLAANMDLSNHISDEEKRDLREIAEDINQRYSGREL